MSEPTDALLHSHPPDADLVLRPMTLSDIDQVTELEQACFSTPWSKESFRFELLQNKNSLCFVVEKGKKRVIAYTVCWFIADEMHIANIAVAADQRRQGVGAWLIESILNLARKWGTTIAHLEVRRSNEAAIHLYQRYGFQVVGIRPHYYPPDGEDALLMSYHLKVDDQKQNP